MKFPKWGLTALAVCVVLGVLQFASNPNRVLAPATPVATRAPTAAATLEATTQVAACVPGVVTFAAEGFSAWFPCAPERVIRKANAVPFGEIQIITYQTTVDGVDYAAAYVNYADKLPAAAFDLAKVLVLDGAKRSLVRGQPVTNPVYKDVTLGALSGVEVNAEGAEKALRGRVWVARQVTYQMVALYPKGYADQERITKFIEAFAVNLTSATAIATSR